MKLGRLIARVVIGALFFGHGAQKLFGWFGGGGLDGTGQFMESLGFKPGRRHALASGLSEAGGGAMIALGLLTPAAAASLIATMAVAAKTVHVPNGVWVSDGGYEYNVVLIAALLALVDGGPGPVSLDAKLGIEETGPALALAALAAGAIGAGVVLNGAESDES
ncbi:DoxX family protein [Thermoleophilia bacterium SCSIO 60948]|nr:DoxX family protein [Thermoleophilia bacterium SCSIO 60948]